jgi:Mce-associated membrane protein
MADDADAADEELSESAADEPRSDATDPESSEGTEAPEVETAEREAKPGGSRVRLALVTALIAVLALGGLGGWLGYRTYETRQTQNLRNLFLQAGRQGATNLTTISYTEAEADVQRVLDSSTGTFYDDFKRRAPTFIEVVKQSQSKSVGTVTEAGVVTPVEHDHADVLVAVTVTTANGGAPEQKPRAWRMRIGVQKVGNDAKFSRVDFVS